MGSKRSYFDYLSSVRWKKQEFDDILVTQTEVYGIKAHEDTSRRRVDQFPQYHLRPRSANKPTWKNKDACEGVKTTMVEKGLSAHLAQLMRRQGKEGGGPRGSFSGQGPTQ